MNKTNAILTSVRPRQDESKWPKTRFKPVDTPKTLRLIKTLTVRSVGAFGDLPDTVDLDLCKLTVAQLDDLRWKGGSVWFKLEDTLSVKMVDRTLSYIWGSILALKQASKALVFTREGITLQANHWLLNVSLHGLTYEDIREAIELLTHE